MEACSIVLKPRFRTNISLVRRNYYLQLALQPLLLTALQLILTSGVGTVLIVGYATKDLFSKEENLSEDSLRFASEYQELMWLAERQKHHSDVEETQRFYQLRHDWTRMHSFNVT